MNQQPFALTGLTSRGGLSNWVFFFFPTETVMIDVGATPAIKAGVRAGVRGQFGLAGRVVLGRPVYGPQNEEHQALDEWRGELQAKAKSVRILKDGEIRTVRLHLKAMAHEVFIVSADEGSHKFGLTNRAEAEAVVDSLSRRFDSRFETSTTGPFAFFKRYAPFLMR
jgi:hypothetical protein